jgi:uncharacterized protein YaiE (UPF0345 family)
MQFENVTAVAKGNVYFDGKVVSHVIVLASGEKKSLGVIQPGEYHFGTDAAEIMEMVGEVGCSYVLDGTTETIEVPAGSSFSVTANSGFTITICTGVACHYVCSYIQE